MPVDTCPSCGSDQVGGWSGGHGTCEDCQKFVFNSYEPCFRCKGRRITWVGATPAKCDWCGWEGSPYDLIEAEAD